MVTCTVRWRPSGGRGEFEYVPADSLEDRAIDVLFEPLGIVIPAEVRGVKAQGKPRLRKNASNNRKKLHLPQLVMAVARLPDPAREDLTHTVSFPLENKNYILDSMDFDIIEDDGMTVTLAPLRASILHSDFVIDLQDRFKAVAIDLGGLDKIALKHPEVASAVQQHGAEVKKGVNSSDIRSAADRVIQLQGVAFGMTNASSVTKLDEAEDAPETDLEAEIVGKEGRLLVRIHAYKERDRNLTVLAKKSFKGKHGGKLLCEACGLDPIARYGANGERAIEAHHKIPIEQLQPDSITRADDMAMVCASCHRIIHSRKPCLTIQQVRDILNDPSA